MHSNFGVWYPYSHFLIWKLGLGFVFLVKVFEWNKLEQQFNLIFVSFPSNLYW
jgi:hypothetical protein